MVRQHQSWWLLASLHSSHVVLSWACLILHADGTTTTTTKEGGKSLRFTAWWSFVRKQLIFQLEVKLVSFCSSNFAYKIDDASCFPSHPTTWSWFIRHVSTFAATCDARMAGTSRKEPEYKRATREVRERKKDQRKWRRKIMWSSLVQRNSRRIGKRRTILHPNTSVEEIHCTVLMLLCAVLHMTEKYLRSVTSSAVQTSIQMTVVNGLSIHMMLFSPLFVIVSAIHWTATARVIVFSIFLSPFFPGNLMTKCCCTLCENRKHSTSKSLITESRSVITRSERWETTQ